jgi:hypothetical protein
MTLCGGPGGAGGASARPPATPATPLPTPATHFLGVRGVWVAPGTRRAGVAAAALLDAAQAGGRGRCPSRSYPRRGLAFSQPTAAGAGLAGAYGGAEGGLFAVYE